MNILTNGADSEDIKLYFVGGLMKAARLGSNVSTAILTGAGKSGDPTQRSDIYGSVEAKSARDQGIDNLEDTNLITRSNYIKQSEFLLDMPVRADEYYR